MIKRPSILFIGKKDDSYCEQAVEFIKLHFSHPKVILGRREDCFPNLAGWEGDYIISYLSPWVIPEYLLKKAHKASINFHPGPPEYPGIGCTNFALYNQEKVFGITCHHMDKKVDTGQIIAVRRFLLYETDTVFSLTQRCYAHILVLFYEIVSLIMNGQDLPRVNEYWTREPFKRKELNDLCEITADMPQEEVRRRVNAVAFPNAPGAYIKIGNMKFNYLSQPQQSERIYVAKKNLILVGGGGHCRSCIDVIEAEGRFKTAGIIDTEERFHQRVLDYEVTANDKDLPNLVGKYKDFLITIGFIKDPCKRIEKFEYLKTLGARFPVIVSPWAHVSKSAWVGEGTIVMHQVIVNSGASIGKNCIVNTSALIEHDAQIGEHSQISTGSIINGECHIGSRVFIGSNSVVVNNVNIGDDVVIGAGSVVTQSIGEAGTYVGKPARRVN